MDDRVAPDPGAPYLKWLHEHWQGDARELRKGRYLHQQSDLQRAFTCSPFWSPLELRLDEWARTYEQTRGFPLFQAKPSRPEINAKTWESFLSRNWRYNVRLNNRWPQPPEAGWLFPDSWFERSWDVIRTRFVVRYLDGVEWLAECLEQHAEASGVASRRVVHAQDQGYYAIHILVPQTFPVQSLNYEDDDERHTEVELQITTELQEIIGALTHGYFEERREAPTAPQEKWQWKYDSPEFTPYYLGHILHYLEGMIMHVRNELVTERDERAEG